MGDHLVINVEKMGVAPSSFLGPSEHRGERELAINEEEQPLVSMAECRICQDEDLIQNLDNPCTCSGSLKYAHRACVQRWCNEKGNITCEICHQSYRNGYTAPPRIIPDETTIDISGTWTITGTPFDLHDPRILAVATSQNQLLGSDYEDYAANSGTTSFFRTAALIFMGLLLLKPALFINDEDDDGSAIFSLFVLRTLGFLLPFYIMAWAISIIQHRRQTQEAAAALAATEMAFILQSGQGSGLHFTIAPDSPTTPQGEP
ncbi:uncharacterized protein LOC144573774 isoform X1 [Carex rostrata]|uniref:E3 ubiquitin-protein ligase MARCH11 n=1 Tax=Carex littledalei TaxID=544730 RepID=A0A833V3P8_9POAL|nr:E3 ubiquitin-protein ligase MARCH11 [Carex littledalei]